MSSRHPLAAVAAALALIVLGVVCASAGAAGLSDDAGAEWRLEQPAPPEPSVGVEASGQPVPLGKIGDVEFDGPNRGALITAGNGSTVPAGIWVYNGKCEGDGPSATCAPGWHELANVCGASDHAAIAPGNVGHGRIVWASPEEFWTISDGRTGQALETNGSAPPLEDNTLCRFAINRGTGRWEVAKSYASLAFQASSYQAMSAGACMGSEDCWFGGELLPAPQVGSFQLHWNGRTLTPEPFLAEGHKVGDMSAFAGHVYESVRLEQGDRIIEKQGKVGEQPSLHVTGPEGGFESVLGLPLLESHEFPTALDFLHLSSDENALWGAASPARETPEKSEPAGVTVVRYSTVRYSTVSHEYVEEEEPSWTQVVGPCPLTASGCEAEPPTQNPFQPDVARSIAAEPRTNSAWIALAPESSQDPTLQASVARVSADGTITDRLELPEGKANPLGAAETIVCPGEHDCWMATTQGWLFHLSTEGERDDPDPNTEAAFAGGYLITERPPDEGVPNEVSTAFVEGSSGLEESPPPPPVKPVLMEPFATVTLPLLSNIHARLVHGSTLQLSFHLSVVARLRLIAKRHMKVVARTSSRTFKAGNRSLLLKLNVHQWPTKLSLQTHALAPLKTVSTRESSSSTDTVSTSLSFPNTRQLLDGGSLLGSGLLP
jgi:hypothetical protein